MKVLGILGMVMVFGSIIFMAMVSADHAAMDKCQRTHSYETCFQIFNR